MSSSLRRGTLAATVLALSALTLAACGAGNDAETLRIEPDSAAATVGDIEIQGVSIVTEEGPSNRASVVARIFNSGDRPETLKAIRIGKQGAGTQVELSPAAGARGLRVPAHGSLALGGEGNASALIASAMGPAFQNGSSLRITFDFSDTGDVHVRPIVAPASQDNFAEFGPSGNPSPRPSAPAPSATPTGTPGGKPTESTGPGAEGSPSAGADGDHAGGGDSPEDEHAGHAH